MQNDHLHMIVPKWPVPSHVKSLQTTREGGFSAAPFDSLNLAMHVQDNPLAVAKNRQLLAAYLPTEPVWVNQVHGVEAIDAAQSTCLQNADASFTTQKNVVCVTMTADCLPILLCDVAGTVVAAVHAGWRGLCDGVIEETVRKMPVAPNLLMAWLGPAIGPNAFEIGGEVRQQFIDKDTNAASAFTPKADKWLGNLYLIAQQRLNALGVHQLYGAGINEDFCTYTDEVRFFSFRRASNKNSKTNGQTGRMASLIWLE